MLAFLPKTRLGVAATLLRGREQSMQGDFLRYPQCRVDSASCPLPGGPDEDSVGAGTDPVCAVPLPEVCVW